MKINLKKFLLIFAGFLIASSYVWIRFIRERLPRNIPFEVTLPNITFLLFICIIYIIIIKNLIKPSNKLIVKFYENFPKSYEYLYKYTSYLYESLDALDNFIKEHTYIKPRYVKYMTYFILSFKDLITTEKEVRYLIIITHIIPQVILLFAFIIDITCNKQIKYLFMAIPISIISLLHIYVIYSFKKYKEERLKFLKTKYQKVSTDTSIAFFSQYDGIVDLRDFIEIQAFQFTSYTEKTLHKCDPIIHPDTYESYRKEYNIPDNQPFTDLDWEKMEADFYNLMPIVIYLELFLEHLYPWGAKINLLRNIKVTINGIFLCCWLYILFKTIL